MSSTFVSTAGGVITEKAGPVTGELDLLTRVTPDGEARRGGRTGRPDGGAVEAVVRYAGAQGLCPVLGSSVHAVSWRPDQAEHRAAHERILETLTTQGRIDGGNEMPVDV